jgi:hypothetical protein
MHTLAEATAAAATRAAATTAAAAVDRRGRGRGKLRGLASLPYGGLSRTGGHKLLAERTAFCTAVLTLTATADAAAVHSGAATAGDAATIGNNSHSATAGAATDDAAVGEAASVATDHVHSSSNHSISSSQYDQCTNIPTASVSSATTPDAADSDDTLLSYYMAAAPETTAAGVATEQCSGGTNDSTEVTAHYTLYAALIGQRLQQRLTGVHERTAKDALWSCMRSVIETTVNATTVNGVIDATDSSSAGCGACTCTTAAQQQQQQQPSSSSCSSSTATSCTCSSRKSGSSANSSSSSTSGDCEWQRRLQHAVRLLLCTCTALKALLGLGSRALVKLAALMFEGLRDCNLPDTGNTYTAHASSHLLISTCRANHKLHTARCSSEQQRVC